MNIINKPASLDFSLHLFIRHKRIRGFTLIELMIVILIMGLLAAVSIPVFIGQIGKSRESELLLTIGTMARSQQNYHHLYGRFALTMSELESDTGPINPKYYDVDHITPVTGSFTGVKIQAVPLNSGKDTVRNYAVGVYFDDGAYYRSTCQGAVVGEEVQVGDTPEDDCRNNGIKIY